MSKLNCRIRLTLGALALLAAAGCAGTLGTPATVQVGGTIDGHQITGSLALTGNQVTVGGSFAQGTNIQSATVTIPTGK